MDTYPPKGLPQEVLPLEGLPHKRYATPQKDYPLAIPLEGLPPERTISRRTGPIRTTPSPKGLLPQKEYP